MSTRLKVTLPRQGGFECAAHAECQGSGYGNYCVAKDCTCKIDNECRGLGMVCTNGTCKMRDSCGVGRFCPSGFSCDGIISGKCERKPKFGITIGSILAACAKDTSGTCAKLGTAAIKVLPMALKAWKTKSVDMNDVMARVKPLVVTLVVNAIKDPVAVRELIVNLDIDAEILNCAKISEATLDNAKEFEVGLLKFLRFTLQADTTKIRQLRQQIRTGDNHEAANDALTAYITELVNKLATDLEPCVQDRTSESCTAIFNRPFIGVFRGLAPCIGEQQDISNERRKAQFSALVSKGGSTTGGAAKKSIVKGKKKINKKAGATQKANPKAKAKVRSN